MLYEQFGSLLVWEISSTGATGFDAVHEAYARLPSRQFQPKLAPRPRPPAFGVKSTSSTRSWPTSPIVRSPVDRSNEKRHGLRSPYAQISGLAPATPTNGLSAGTWYGAFDFCCGLMRRSLPHHSPRFCEWPSG